MTCFVDLLKHIHSYSAKVLLLASDATTPTDDMAVASGTIYNEIIIWSAHSGAIRATLSGHQGVIFHIHYVHQLNLLLSTSDDRSINVWRLDIDMDTNSSLSAERIRGGRLVNRLYGHEARVWQCVAFASADTKHYACSIGEDLALCLWSLGDGDGEDAMRLVHRFKAFRKGFKNIWSLCVNGRSMEAVTGWADGGLRKLSLREHTLARTQSSTDPMMANKRECTLTKLNECVTKGGGGDFVRSIVLVGGHVLACTDAGHIYLADTTSRTDDSASVEHLTHSELLAGHSVMSKVNVSETWLVAVGTRSGSLCLVTIDFSRDHAKSSTQHSVEFIDEASRQETQSSTRKICSVLWSHDAPTDRCFLACGFGLSANGLTRLYELERQPSGTMSLSLVASLSLPHSKHRWLTSLAIAYITPSHETICLVGGDKCGNLHLFRIEQVAASSSVIIEPVETVRNVTKQGVAISAIFSRRRRKSSTSSHSVLFFCCCKDGFYCLFELNEHLTLVGKRQVAAANLDIIESLVFANNGDADDDDDDGDDELVQLAVCFQGDKFVVWSCGENRPLFEHMCGGANRSWDVEMSGNEQAAACRFCFVRNGRVEGVSWTAMPPLPMSNEMSDESSTTSVNHLRQTFHGNTITMVRFAPTGDYLITCGEDTQIVVSKLDNAKGKSGLLRLTASHAFHLQGHESVVKCVAAIDSTTTNNADDHDELLIVSAGGKASVKVWRASVQNGTQHISKIVHVCESMHANATTSSSGSGSRKPWLNTTAQLLKLNPDVRLMDVCLLQRNCGQLLICFACSDGCVR